MVYQRKQRSEDQQLPIPQVQTSLFASPDLETDDAANSYTGAVASDGPSAEAKLKHAEQHGYNFANISIFPKEGAVQRASSISPVQDFHSKFFPNEDAVQRASSIPPMRDFHSKFFPNEDAVQRASSIPPVRDFHSKFFPNEGAVQRASSIPLVQAKLTVGPAGDKYEQEADRVAASVVDMIHSPVAETSVQRSLDGDGMPPQAWPQMRIQRYSQKDDVQTKLTPNQIGKEGGAASEDVTSEIERAKGGGQKLDQGLQHRMGKAMGTDFSRVRIHTDATSDQINQTIQAKAFTTGSDVFFRQGQYNPGTKSGQQLIAHELTHVVQQGQAIQRTLAPEEEAQIKNIKVSDDEELQKKPDSTSSSQASNLSGVIQRDGRSKLSPDAEDKGGGNITVVTRKSKGWFKNADLTEEQVKKIQKSVKAAREIAANALTKVKALRTAYDPKQMKWTDFIWANRNAGCFADNLVGDCPALDLDEKPLALAMRKVETVLSRTQQGLAANIKLVENKPEKNNKKIVGYLDPAVQEIDENTKHKKLSYLDEKGNKKDDADGAEYDDKKTLKKASAELITGKKNKLKKNIKEHVLVDIPFLSDAVLPSSIHINFVHFLFKLNALNGGRIILHEATHKFANTKDHQYMRDICGHDLGVKKGVENADGYAWYAYVLKEKGV
ncbi:MAG: DUF4157 domain-containing protein [Cyanobacteria bacterium P01_A01_bin.123]